MAQPLTKLEITTESQNAHFEVERIYHTLHLTNSQMADGLSG